MVTRDGNRDTDPELKGIEVLVVEDEAVVAFDLETTLRGFGCGVLPVAPSVAGALAIILTTRPDAALLDVRLADGSVTPVARALAERRVPFALVTGCDSYDIEEPILRTACRSPTAPPSSGKRFSGSSDRRADTRVPRRRSGPSAARDRAWGASPRAGARARRGRTGRSSPG